MGGGDWQEAPHALELEELGDIRDYCQVSCLHGKPIMMSFEQQLKLFVAKPMSNAN